METAREARPATLPRFEMMHLPAVIEHTVIYRQTRYVHETLDST